MLLVGLEGFKLVKRLFGSRSGRQAARHGGSQPAGGPADTAARIGGDGFTVSIEDVEEVEEAVRLAERILEELYARP